MKTKEELRKMDTKKLLEELAEVEKTLAENRFNVETGHSKESHNINKYKTLKAQIKTIISEKEKEQITTSIN